MSMYCFHSYIAYEYSLDHHRTYTDSMFIVIYRFLSLQFNSKYNTL